MGGCCVPQNQSSCDFTPPCRFTDFDLMKRQNTIVLSRLEAELVLKQNLDAVVLRYAQSIEKVLEKGPMEERTLAKKLQAEIDTVVGYFKYCFRSTTPGGNISFDDIKQTEKHLLSRLSELNAAAEFINQRKSYDACTNIASDLMKQFQCRRQNPSKAMSLYRAQAVGPFAELCGSNLQTLLGEFVCNGEAGMLALRQKQLRKELRLVHSYRSNALSKCSPTDIQSLTPDPFSVPGSFLFNSSHSRKAAMSIIEVIERFPSVDSSDMGKEASVDRGRLGIQRLNSKEGALGDEEGRGGNGQGLCEFGDAEKTMLVLKDISVGSDPEDVKGESDGLDDVRKTAAI